MCTVSAVIDNWGNNFPGAWPNIMPSYPTYPTVVTVSEVSKEDFEALKREVQELKELIKAAKHFDEVTGQKDCEKDEKIALLKKIAELVGVDLSDLKLEGK